MVSHPCNNIQIRVLTFDTVFLHGSNLFECKAKRIYDEGYFTKIQPISFIEFNGDNEEDKQNEETWIVN